MTANGAPAQDRHVPVLLERCVALLAPALERPGSVVVDATLGMGGHSEALLERCPHAVLVGIDRDPQALGPGRRPVGRTSPTGCTWCTRSTTSFPRC